MVRDTKTPHELIESIGGIIMSPVQLRAQRRLFAYGNTAIENPEARATSLRAQTPTSSGSSAPND